MTTFCDYNTHMMLSNLDDAISASVPSSHGVSAEEIVAAGSSVVCYTSSGPTFYYQASTRLFQMIRDVC